MQANCSLFASTWVVDNQPAEEDVQVLRQHLRAFNRAHANSADGHGLAIFLRDEQGQMIGGISGWLWGQCLEIDQLWVDDEWRGQGFGKRLVQTLEQAAVARGCRQITLETFSFQAPELYLKLGYRVFGVIASFGGRHQKFYLQKRST